MNTKENFPQKPATQIVVSTDRSRSVFQKTVEEHKANGKMVVPAYLRVEQKIVNGKTIYTFPITRDANSDTITELKLDRNDKFKVDRLGLFLIRRDRNLIGHEVLNTYPNYIEFYLHQTNNVTDFEPLHLEAFYNGKLSLIVGQTKWIEAMDTARFRLVHMGQQALTTDGNVPPSIINYVQASERHENSGFIEMTPQITLDGNEKNTLSIEAPIQSGHMVENKNTDMDNYLVIVARGLLITSRR